MQRSSDQNGGNAALFWPVLAAVVAVDVVTKFWAARTLVERVPVGVIDGWLRWMLVYNPGAAFGLNVGSPSDSRWVFMALTIIALGILSRLYVATRSGDVPRVLALALVCAGAVGNLIDRIRGAQGVVDFIDVGVASARWPTFNLADVAVSLGAFLLAWVLWSEDRETEREASAAEAAAASAHSTPVVVAPESGEAS